MWKELNKIDKFNKIATTINATRGLHEMEQQVINVKNSSLTEEEKNKALKSHNKMVKTVVWFVIALVIAMGIFMKNGKPIYLDGIISLGVIPFYYCNINIQLKSYVNFFMFLWLNVFP